MSPAQFSLRRATVDDLPVLRALWDSMRFSTHDLEKRLTEFQIAVNPEGKVVGAVGFEMQQRHGRIHSEAYSDFSAADSVRPMLWTRLQSLCSNHGVLRLWTQEVSPFWSHNGLTPPADEAERQKLPETWRAIEGNWLTLKLKDEEAIASVDKEFALFMQTEKARSAEALTQAQKLKTIATVIAFIVAFLGFGGAIYLFVNRGSFRQEDSPAEAAQPIPAASVTITTAAPAPVIEQPAATTNTITSPEAAK
jgi:N-acetylglutamate synthase-like GNAT family acetyltransferase